MKVWLARGLCLHPCVLSITLLYPTPDLHIHVGMEQCVPATIVPPVSKQRAHLNDLLPLSKRRRVIEWDALGLEPGVPHLPTLHRSGVEGLPHGG